MALDEVISHLDQASVCVPLVGVCSIFSDSQAAVRVAGFGGSSLSFPRLASAIRSRLRRLEGEFGVAVSVHWIPGHAGIPGNEQADRLAGEACSRAAGLREGQDMVRVGLPIVRAWTNKKALEAWQLEWSNSRNGADLRRFKTSVKAWTHLDVGLHSDASLVTQLLTGHVHLNQPLFDQNRAHHTTNGSPDCPFCDDVEESIDHFLCSCPMYDEQRSILRGEVRLLTPAADPSSLRLLFGGEGIPLSAKRKIQISFQHFVRPAFRQRDIALESLEPD